MYTITINGVKHQVSEDDTGSPVYNPPLPDEQQKRFKSRLKDMVKHGKAPGSRTDGDFHAGRGTLLDQMEGDEVYVSKLVSEAKKKGYNPGANDVYIGQIADSTGDPKAFFKPGEGRSELIRRCKQHGKGLDMPGVHVEAKPYQEPKGPALNPKITNTIKKHYKSTGQDNGMSDSELTKHVVEKHGRKR